MNHAVRTFAVVSIALLLASLAGAQGTITVQTRSGPLIIRPIKHASVLMEFKGKVYYIDPAALDLGTGLPKADVIFVTHEHADHCDPRMVQALRKPGTVIVANQNSAAKLGAGVVVMKNGDSRKVADITVQAVPAYNIVRTQYHPKGRDNGYILTFGGKRIYFAGDTEGTPEMKALRGIDYAFLPINLPFTMPPAEAAAAARAFKPKVLVPYHQGPANPQEVADALKGSGIKVIVLKLP